MTEAAQREKPFRILCVCTGNVYRSRIAEDALSRELRERLGSSAERFVVRSAGTRAVTDRPLHPEQADDLDRLGLGRGLRPGRHLAAVDVGAADLVLGADRDHRIAVLELVPGAMRRTFMLGELARIASTAAELAGLESPRPGADPVERARQVVAAASTHRGAVPRSGSDEIADPWNQPDAVLDLVAGQVRDAVRCALDGLVGPGAGAGRLGIGR